MKSFALLSLALGFVLPVAQAADATAFFPRTPRPWVAEANPSKEIPLRPLNLNQASAEELATLPGIGKVTARRIVELREKNGPFRRLEELLIIRGISEKKLEKIRGRLTLGNASTLEKRK